MDCDLAYAFDDHRSAVRRIVGAFRTAIGIHYDDDSTQCDDYDGTRIVSDHECLVEREWITLDCRLCIDLVDGDANPTTSSKNGGNDQQ